MKKIIDFLQNKWVLTFSSLLILWLIGNFIFYFHKNIIKYNFFYVTGILIFFIFIFNALGKIKQTNENNGVACLDHITEINEDKRIKVANIVLGLSAITLFFILSLDKNALINEMKTVLNLNTVENLTNAFNHTHFINIYLVKYFFLFIGLISLLTYIKSDKLAEYPETHFQYGLTQILLCVVLLSSCFCFLAYTIFFLSKDFLSSKDAFEFSKWMIGALGLGLNAFNIKIFVDYFRGAKNNAPYSLEQLQQLEALQNIKSSQPQTQNNISVLDDNELRDQALKIKNKVPL